MNEHISTSTWADWLMMHRKLAMLISILIVLAVAGTLWFMQSSNAQKIKDFETADVLADELEKNPPLFEEQSGMSKDSPADLALNQLADLDKRYEILQPRFDSLIAQEMLLRDNKNELDPFAKRAVGRLRALGLDDFAEYSEISRLCGLHLYKEALQKAQSLQAKLVNKKKTPATANTSHDFMLEAFLLLKLATLNQQLGNTGALLQNVVELKSFLGLTKREVPLTIQQKELASQMLSHLQEKQSSLLEFIEEVPKTIGA